MAEEYKKMNMKTLQAEARSYGINVLGKSKEELYDEIQQAKQNDVALQRAKEIREKDPNDLSEAEKIYKENMKLIRVSVSSNDPNDSELTGVLHSVTISSKILKEADMEVDVTRFIPFDTDWHAEKCIVDSLAEKIYFREKKYKRKKEDKQETGYERIPARKYNIEYLDPLTKEEIEDIKLRQRAQNTIGD
jgi:hypothetical protein